ncbi:hypothetical protein [Lysobacter sp. F6437]|uniref:hypothetical protein n=1 Tax=Lysobacter sp. F6437 TaxID=3459296 RepID=UPI00403D9637
MESQPPPGGRDWDNIRFGSRSNRPAEESAEDRAQSRFVIGIAIFLTVALAYPWYSYWVSARITAYGLQVMAEQLGQELKQSESEARRQRVASTQAQAAAENRRQVAAVRVVGATRTRNGPVVIVRLGDATTGEARGRICVQAEALLKESLDGESVRVQMHRGNQPALDAGRIRC